MGLLSGVLVPLALGACSSDIPTGAPNPDDFFPTVDFTKIVAHFSVFERIVDGSGGETDTTLRATASFFDGLGNPVGFAGTVTVNDTIAILRSLGYYEAILERTGPGHPYRFTVSQRGQAPIVNILALPLQRFSFTEPQPGEAVNRSESFHVAWDPSDEDSIAVSLYVSSSDGRRFLERLTIPDVGVLEYSESDLIPVPPGDLLISGVRFRRDEPSGFRKESTFSTAFLRSQPVHFPAAGAGPTALTLVESHDTLRRGCFQRTPGYLPRTGRMSTPAITHQTGFCTMTRAGTTFRTRPGEES